MAIVGEFPALNGGEQSLLSVIPGLQTSGFSFTAFVPDGDFADALSNANVDVKPFDFRAQGTRKPLEALRQQLAEALVSQTFDLVHCNSLSVSRIVGPVCKQSNLVCLGYLRDIIKLNATAVADLNSCTRLIAVSHATRNFHTSQGMDGDSIHVVHNGVDLDHFRPDQPNGYLHDELKIAKPAPLILFVGQIGLRKAPELWLQTAEIITQEFPDAQFVIVGERNSQKQESIEYEEKLIQFSGTGSLAGRVHWLGRRQDVHNIMRESSLLIHLARQEPFGRVLLEAFGSGLPTVATNVGGTNEIFASENLQLWMVEKDNISQAAEKAVQLLSDDQLRKQVAAQVRDHAVRNLAVEFAADRLRQHYEELLNIRVDPST